MRTFLTITKALNDKTRLRILLALRQRELCLCQLVELLGLAPSTVSKHLNILYEGGLINRRKQGRWAYFELVKSDASPAARRALRWVTASLEEDTTAIEDTSKVNALLQVDLQELSECYA